MVFGRGNNQATTNSPPQSCLDNIFAGTYSIGVFAVAVIRISVLSICRCTMYRAFYRERPFSANISLLALEWANFSLSVGFILVRMIKLVISACMFIGRIDTPFLAPKVGQIGPIELDNYPTIFMKDLLQHEGTVLWIFVCVWSKAYWISTSCRLLPPSSSPSVHWNAWDLLFDETAIQKLIRF